MSGFGLAWAWCAVQITILGVAGALVYSAARRYGPAVGSLITSTTLVLMSCLTMLAFAPLPAWTARMIPRTNDESVRESQSVQKRDADASSTPVHVKRAPAPEADAGVLSQEFVRALRHELAQVTHADGPQARRSWWAAGGMLFVILSVGGLTRIALSFRAVHRVRRRTIALRDGSVTDCVEELAHEMGGRRPPIELRESSELGSAATWGWLRPIIVLPIEWREWSPQTLRAVLAHELAHILRGDYLMWLVAQVGVALHAYHPVVHWLARRLRQDQECAADVTACQVVGGPRAYLTVLATMAIQQDDRRLGLSAHPFLPSRRTFLRRIEMLRDLKRVPLPPSPAARYATVAALLALAVVASGFRAMHSESAVFGQPPKPPAIRGNQAAAGEQGAVRFEFVPRDAAAVLVARPSQLLNNPLLQSHRESLQQLEKAMVAQFGIPLGDMEQISAIFLMRTDTNRGPEEPCIVIRTKSPIQHQEQVIAALAPNAKAGTYGDYKVYESTERFCAFPDDNTVIAARQQGILRRILVAGAKSAPVQSVAGTWSKVVDADAALFVNTGLLRPTLDFGLTPEAGPDQERAVLASLAPLWQKTTSFAGSIKLSDQTQLQLLADGQKAENLPAIKDTLEAAMTLGRNVLSSARSSASRQPDPQGPTLLKSIDLAEAVLDQMKVTEEGTIIAARGSLDGQQAVELANVLSAGAIAAQSAARRTQSANNLKQLALAMHNYYDANQHFPAATIVGPDGKTEHSWRVALLPYVEQEALYRQYHFDEPWDSPANMKVMEQMPAVFRDPTEPADSKSSSYYVVTGKGTIFDDADGTKFQEITDGTSNTILIVEAQSDIPWTKPEDIGINADQGNPKVGGHYAEGFWAAFADGSVRFIANTADPNMIRFALLKADGMVIQLP